MKHYGDITQLSGYDLPVVDVITGGSPCQDLSVAGGRKGLSGKRSGLFVEQIRIVKEMRERDVRSGRSGHLVRPRYLIWENVPGAFSSNNGEDFRIVLEEICKVAEETAVVPKPQSGGANGHRVAASWETGGPLLGEYTMHSFGECPREENESHLSQILVEQAHPKYSLSGKACRGILNRAERRGKELPVELKKALENQCSAYRGGV